MICPQCRAEGKKSRVYPGSSTSTLLHCDPFYDEDGEMHHHDMNTTTTTYRCGEGHEWTESSGSSCWCGWPGNGES